MSTNNTPKTMKWGPEQDHEILIFILEHCDVKVPYQELAAHFGCTPKAVTHRIANLKKAVKEQRENAGTNNSSNEETASATPRKRARAPGAKTKSSKAAKKPKIEVESDAEEDYVDATTHVAETTGVDVGED